MKIYNLIRKVRLFIWAIFHLPRKVFIADTNYKITGWDWRVALLAKVETTKIEKDRLWYEPKEHKYFIDLIKRDGLFFDIGANIGYYCFLAAHYGAKKVVGVEIIKSYANFAKKYLKKNKINAVILNCAVGSGKEIEFKDSIESGKAEVRTLDSIGEEHGYPNMMKMDIEGWEYDALMSAKKILERAKPTLDISIHPMFLENFGRSEEEVKLILQNFNYKEIITLGDTHFLK